MRLSVPPVARCWLSRNMQRVDLGRPRRERHDRFAGCDVEDVDRRAVAGGGDPSCHPAKRPAHECGGHRFRCRAGSNRRSRSKCESCRCGRRPPCVALRRERDRANVDAGAIQLLRRLARRGVDDFQLVAEADDRQLLIVRMQAHGGDRILAGGVWNTGCCWPRFHMHSAAIAGAGGERRAVGRKHDRVDPIGVAVELRFQLAGRRRPKSKHGDRPWRRRSCGRPA